MFITSFNTPENAQMPHQATPHPSPAEFRSPGPWTGRVPSLGPWAACSPHPHSGGAQAPPEMPCMPRDCHRAKRSLGFCQKGAIIESKSYSLNGADKQADSQCCSD